jgi:hypothetical protein
MRLIGHNGRIVALSDAIERLGKIGQSEASILSEGCCATLF